MSQHAFILGGNRADWPRGGRGVSCRWLVRHSFPPWQSSTARSSLSIEQDCRS